MGRTRVNNEADISVSKEGCEGDENGGWERERTEPVGKDLRGDVMRARSPVWQEGDVLTKGKSQAEALREERAWCSRNREGGLGSGRCTGRPGRATLDLEPREGSGVILSVVGSHRVGWGWAERSCHLM